MRAKEITQIALGTALIAIGAFIKIPSPVAGYFTLQLPLLILVAVALGSKMASESALLYMAGGLIGIPWFAAGGGIGYTVKPTFGFIISFIIGGYIAGKGHNQDKKYIAIFYGILAVLFVWIFGMVWLVTVSKFYLGMSFSYYGVLSIFASIDFYTDIILAIIFSSVGLRISKVIEWI